MKRRLASLIALGDGGHHRTDLLQLRFRLHHSRARKH